MEDKGRYSEYIRGQFADAISVLSHQMDQILSNAEFRDAEEMNDDLEAVIMKYAREK